MAILGFKNLSGATESGWLSTGLTEMLRAELAAGKRIRTISGEEVAHTRTDLSLADTDSLSPETFAAIRKRLAADMVLLDQRGDRTGCRGTGASRDRNSEHRTGETTISITRSGTQASLFDMLTSIGATLRKQLGEGELTASEAQALKSAYPAELAAERLYAEGLAELPSPECVAARPLLEKAVEMQPSYPFAYSALAACGESPDFSAMMPTVRIISATQI